MGCVNGKASADSTAAAKEEVAAKGAAPVDVKVEPKKEEKKVDETTTHDEDESEEEDDDDDIVDDLPPPPQNLGKMRTSVSAEAYGAWNKKEEFTPPVFEKSEEQATRLKDTLSKSFMFSALDDKESKIIIDAMEEVTIAAGDKIISLGDQGDCLYVIETGTLECRKEIDGEDKLLKTVNEGDVFGELALLYNVTRQANVIAGSDCTCWKLDRKTFGAVVRDSAAKKREMHEGFLKKVPLLKDLGTYEINQIADGLQVKNVTAGTKIISEGDQGDAFYILEDGTATADKDGVGKVKDYASGDFFGELALLNDAPRAATVNAETDCKLLYLSRRTFKRLFCGPSEMEKLKAVAATY